jgi:hypothetical protein
MAFVGIPPSPSAPAATVRYYPTEKVNFVGANYISAGVYEVIIDVTGAGVVVLATGLSQVDAEAQAQEIVVALGLDWAG